KGTSSRLTMELSDQTLASTGASGTRTATASSSAANIGQLIALRPGAGGPPPPNQPPNAVANSYATTQDAALVEPAPGVLGNDSDLDGDSLNAVLDATVLHGALALAADGGFTYTPTAGYTGGDTFTYHATDGTDDSATVVVSLTVTAAGAGVSFRASASAANTGTNNLVLPRPVGTVAGDVLVAGVSVRGTPTITPPAGWTAVRNDPRGSTFSQALYVHVAGGAEPASYTWSFSAAGTAVGTIAAYSGVDTAQPVAGHGGQVNTGTAIVAASLTTSVPNTRLVGFFGIVGKPTVSPPPTMIERQEIVTAKGTSSRLTMELSDQTLASTGASGTRTATASSSAANIGQLIALRPAP
ncbi:MAG TPA: Ig-like domain-containing protein, partial [Candidatus Limnocylindria bacterium]